MKELARSLGIESKGRVGREKEKYIQGMVDPLLRADCVMQQMQAPMANGEMAGAAARCTPSISLPTSPNGP